MAARSLSKADVIGIVLAFLVLLPVAAQVVDAEKEQKNRQVCAANLRGTAQSMNVYAADNEDAYPIYTPNAAATYSAKMEAQPAGKTAEDAINKNYKSGRYGDNPPAAMWLVVLTGMIAPRQYICPSDTFAGTAAEVTKDRLYFGNFQKSQNISYSSAFPWTEGKGGKPVISGLWRNATDASLPLVCDMAPYVGKAAKPAEVATRPATAKDTDAMDETWAVTKANSQNHQFAGQNIGFGDAHAEFSRTPIAGQNNDSLWGIQDGKGKESPIAAGKLPHAPTGSPGAWDIVMVPVRNSKGAIDGADPAGGTDLPDLP